MWESIYLLMHSAIMRIMNALIPNRGLPRGKPRVMILIVNSKSNLLSFARRILSIHTNKWWEKQMGWMNIRFGWPPRSTSLTIFLPLYIWWWRETQKWETKREKMAKVPTMKCRKDVLTLTWTRCQGHQHHQNLRGEIPNWIVRSMAWKKRSGPCRAWAPSEHEPL